MIRHLALVAVCTSLVHHSVAQQFVTELDASPPVAISSGVSVPVAGVRGWFGAYDSFGDPGLYTTDGTVAGTQHVLDGWLNLIGDLSGRALFTSANTASVGQGLFVSDGTVAGTSQLLPAVGTTRLLGECGGRWILVEELPLGQSRIWSTDLTAAGTLPLGLFFGSFFAAPLGGQLLLFGERSGAPNGVHPTDGLTFGPSIALAAANDLHPQSNTAPELGGEVYFLARSFSATVTDELWRTDGVTATPVVALGPYAPRRLARAGNGLVITGNQGTTEILFSDGTAAGTAVMTSQTRGYNFVTVGSVAFFLGSDAAHGAELWRTDGTAAGTFLLLDATPGPSGSSLSALTAGISTLYCHVNGLQRLLASDGTVAGTRLGPASTPPIGSSGGLAVLGDTALARTSAGEIVATDCTAANTQVLTSTQLRPGMRGPFQAAALLDELCFVSDDGLHGRELWRTDGTAAGTVLVEDIVPGPGDAVGELVAMRGELWFGVGGALYRSNGTAAGRTLVHDTGAASILSLRAGDTVVSFRTQVSAFSSTLWRSDGTNTVACSIPVGSGGPTLQAGDSTYFTTPSSRLMRWEGQPGGGIDLGAANVILGRIGERVVFANNSSVSVTDGTVAGTSTIGSLPFLARRGQANRRDGGTFLVIQDVLGNLAATDGLSLAALPQMTSQSLAGGDDLVFFPANDSLLGAGLYATDGTAAGTHRIADFGALGAAELTGLWSLGAGNRVLLAIRDDLHGIEPWISDGTAAGTNLLADLNPAGSSDPVLIGAAGGVAYLAADDGVTGMELWRLDLAQVGAADVQELGVGCPGSFGDPLLRSGDTPEVGTTFTTELSHALPGTIALWLFGSQLAVIPVGGGCTLYFPQIDVMLWTLTDGVGASTAAVLIPAAPSLIGASLLQQVGVFDPLGSSPFGTATTQGLRWQVGG